MKISARNVIKGRITGMVKGPVSTEVTLKIAHGIEIVSVISTNSAKNLKLKTGKKAFAVIKASSVMVATD
jgi:molybdopterin-binding protein